MMGAQVANDNVASPGLPRRVGASGGGRFSAFAKLTAFGDRDVEIDPDARTWMAGVLAASVIGCLGLGLRLFVH